MGSVGDVPVVAELDRRDRDHHRFDRAVVGDVGAHIEAFGRLDVVVHLALRRLAVANTVGDLLDVGDGDRYGIVGSAAAGHGDGTERDGEGERRGSHRCIVPHEPVAFASCAGSVRCPMSKKTKKRKARMRRSKANHGKRPNMGRG